jgi:hypothetical protein
MAESGSYVPFPCEEFKGKIDSKEANDIDCSLLPQSITSWPSSRELKVLSLHIYVTEEPPGTRFELPLPLRLLS